METHVHILVFKPLNGQRRENLEFRTTVNGGIGGTNVDDDPLVKAGITRPAAMDLRKDLASEQDRLKEFYSNYLTRKTKKGDSYDDSHSPLYIAFLPRYYILGFHQGIQGNNSTLLQTIGWGDYNNGGANGTFDPLAE